MLGIFLFCQGTDDYLLTVIQRVKAVNAERLQAAIRNHTAVMKDGKPALASPSFNAEALRNDPTLEVSYLIASPRMAYYMKVSAKIYSIYLKYIAPEDIHVYSIDEVFMDVTSYLDHYQMSAHDLAKTMIREVLYETGITATAGIGTNLYLCKLAMDIVAKHTEPDSDGVRIAELNEESFRYLLWDHQPLTDFWQTGPGTARHLARLGISTMGELARASLYYEDRKVERIDPAYRQIAINTGNTKVTICFDDLEEVSGKGIVGIDEFLGIIRVGRN